MGYRALEGVYRNTSLTVAFLGDFVDRGPRQREVLRIVRATVEAGTARPVMGSDEFNAIGFATPDGDNGFQLPHTEKNRAQHRTFLDQVGDGSADHADAVAWFRTLPLWLDLGGLRSGRGSAERTEGPPAASLDFQAPRDLIEKRHHPLASIAAQGREPETE